MIKISGTISDTSASEAQARGVSAASETQEAGDAQETGTAPSEDVVSLSSRTTSAAALLQGVSAADGATADPRIAALSRAVADGSYNPPADKIAQAVVSQETLIARKLSSD